ncbi:MAG: AraC family transcriptional regulator [Chamaesiphon sp. CSU_1_12]|nr:AraC family transcriptional regulator [Chamaesiphon sp. CSU_1_12]
MGIKILDRDSIESKCEQLTALITQHTEGKGDGFHPTAIAGLAFQRESATSAPICPSQGLCTPLFAILVQGKKKAFLGETVYDYGAAQYLVVSVDLPVSAVILEATPDKPYLGFKLDLDPRQFCDLIAQTSQSVSKQENSVSGLFVSTADVPLLDCAVRLTRLLNTPQDIPTIAPMIIREIYYRLLIGEQSEAVRQIATSGSNMQRIASAIQLIKTDFTQTVRIDDLAAQAKMSPSSFYQHFKQVTSMSPIQYQKQLRLLEARRLMLAENSNAASAADRVGYESQSQFSREYSRMFGAPPRKDIDRLRIDPMGFDYGRDRALSS